MSLLFKSRQNSNDKQKKSVFSGGYFFIINIFRQGVYSLGEMWRTPLASMMTIAVLGLSLTLPATLYLVVKNVQQVRSGFEQASEISLFVKENMSEKET
ncbi:cell division protein FtsX, partial [Pseudoalteromonas sp. Angola-31]|nr:cell division protein FtsX [Pseudoalteromonas sp. Angola-31]